MRDALQTVATLKRFYLRRSTSQHHAALQAIASHISAKVFPTPKTASVSHVRKHGSNLVRNSQSMLSGGSACSNLAKAPMTRLPCLVSRPWGSTASDLTSASSTAKRVQLRCHLLQHLQHIPRAGSIQMFPTQSLMVKIHVFVRLVLA